MEAEYWSCTEMDAIIALTAQCHIHNLENLREYLRRAITTRDPTDGSCVVLRRVGATLYPCDMTDNLVNSSIKRFQLKCMVNGVMTPISEIYPKGITICGYVNGKPVVIYDPTRKDPFKEDDDNAVESITQTSETSDVPI